MNRETFKAAWRAVRLSHASEARDGVRLSPALRLVMREEIEPRRTYWTVLSQNMDRIGRGWGAASVADRLFYVRRARAMRRDGFRNNWTGCKQ